MAESPQKRMQRSDVVAGTYHAQAALIEIPFGGRLV